MTHFRAKAGEGFELRESWRAAERRDRNRKRAERVMTGILSAGALYFFVHVVVAVAKGWL